MTSNLLKIYKATKNDDEFRARVEIVCSLENIEFNEDMVIHAAKACVDQIELSTDGAISSKSVEDDLIINAIKTLAAAEVEENETIA